MCRAMMSFTNSVIPGPPLQSTSEVVALRPRVSGGIQSKHNPKNAEMSKGRKNSFCADNAILCNLKKRSFVLFSL
jgi:hypothetical protein